MLEFIGSCFILLASCFIFVAALGAVRFPDSLTRMAAISKSTSLAVMLSALGTTISFTSLSVSFKMFITVIFVLVTTPILAHLISRSARKTKIQLDSRTQNKSYW